MPTTYTDRLLGFNPTSGLPVRIAVDSIISLTQADITLGSGDLTLDSGSATITGGNLAVSSGNLSVGGDAFISGDLTVGGDVVSRNQVNVTVQDQILDLGVGNVSNTASAGGFTVTMNKPSGFTVKTATAFAAAGGGSDATITVDSITGISGGDIIAVSGANEASNNGLFVVLDTPTATTVTIKSSPSASLPFVQNTLVAASSQSASLYKVHLAVALFADGTGNFTDPGSVAWPKGTFVTAYKDGGGTGATESDFTGAGAYDTAAQTSLQEAYKTGAVITTENNVDVAFVLASGNFVVSDSGAVDMDVDGYIRFDADEDSHFIVDGGALDIKTTNSGVLTVSSAGNLEIDGVNAKLLSDGYVVINATTSVDVFGNDVLLDSDGYIHLEAAEDFSAYGITSTELKLNANNASDKYLSILASNVGAGAANIIIDADGYVDLKAGGAVTIDAESGVLTLDGNSGVEVKSVANVGVYSDGYLHLTTTASGDGYIVLDSDGAIHMMADNVEVDSDGYIQMSAGATSEFVVTSGNLTVDSLTGELLLKGENGVTLVSESADFLVVGVLTSEVKLDANNASNQDLKILAVNGHGSGSTSNIVVDADGYIDFKSDGAITVDSRSGILTLDGDAGVEVQSAASVEVTSGNSLRLDSAGNMMLDSDGYIYLTTNDLDGYIQIDSASNLDMTALNITVDSRPDGYVSIFAGNAGLTLDSSSSISLNADAASSFVVNSGNLSLDVMDGYIDGYATDGIVFDTDGYVKLTADEYVEFSSPIISFTSTSGNITLDAQGAGDIILDAVGQVQITATQEVAITVGDTLAEAFSVKSDGYDYIVVDTDGYVITFGDSIADQNFIFAGEGYVAMDSSAFREKAQDPTNINNVGFVYTKADSTDTELFYYADSKAVQITKDGFLYGGSMANTDFTAAGSISQGDALYLASATTVGKADLATSGKQYVVGIALEAASNSQTVKMMAMPGVVISLGAATIAGVTVAAGDEVYLSASGGLTTDVPATIGDVVFRVGYVLTNQSILFQPQLIALVD